MKVISRKNLPVRLSTAFTDCGVSYLLLDKFNAPGWLWGVAFTWFGILLIGGLILAYKQKEVEVF